MIDVKTQGAMTPVSKSPFEILLTPHVGTACVVVAVTVVVVVDETVFVIMTSMVFVMCAVFVVSMVLVMVV